MATHDSTGSIRKPDFDDEVEGLDCFASEGAVIDTADDSGVACFASEGDVIDLADNRGALVESRPALPVPVVLPDEPDEPRTSVWSERGWIALSVVSLLIFGIQVIRQPNDSANRVADAPPAQAPGTPAVPAASLSVKQQPSPTLIPQSSAHPIALSSATPIEPPAPSIAPPPQQVSRPAPAPAVARVAASRPVARSAASARTTTPVMRPSVRPSPAVGTRAPQSGASRDVMARVVVAPAPIVFAESPAALSTPEPARAETVPDPPRAAASSTVIVSATDRSSIERVLEAYRKAYDRLDASSAAVIWPAVDTRALTRAFSTLSQQDVSFDSCDYNITGPRARAHCVGEIRYVGRVGDQVPRVRRLAWSFALERVSDSWQIAQVSAN